MKKNTMLSSAYILALAGAALLYCGLTFPRLDRPGIYEDEALLPGMAANFSILGQEETGKWERVLAPVPYMGGLDCFRYFLLSKCVKLGPLVIRRVSVLTGLAALIAVFALGVSLDGLACGTATALLLAADPNFFVYSRHDSPCAGLAILLGSASALAALAWWRSGRRRYLAAAGLAAGLAVWNHALSLIPLSATAAAAVFLARRKMRSLLGLREMLLAAAAFGVGAAPWLWYTAVSGFETLRLAADATFKNAPATRIGLALLGRHCRILSASLNGGRVEDYMLDHLFPIKPTYFVWPLLAASAFLFMTWRNDRRDPKPLWAVLVVALCAAAIVAVPSFYAPHHVVLALFPWPQLLVGLAVARLARRFEREGAYAALGCALVVFSANLRATWWIRRNIIGDSVIYSYSWQVQRDLVDFVNAHDARIVPVDWGFYRSLRLLAPKADIADYGFAEMLDEDPGGGGKMEVRRTLGRPGNLYVLHSESLTFFHAARRNFFAAVKENGMRESLVRVINWNAAEARPIFEIYAVGRP